MYQKLQSTFRLLGISLEKIKKKCKKMWLIFIEYFKAEFYSANLSILSKPYLEDIVVDQYGWDFIEDDDDEDNEISEDLLGFGMDNLFENRRSRRQKVHMKRDSQLMSTLQTSF